MKTVYGYDVNPNGDPFVELADQALEGIRIVGNVGSVLVDYIPVLKYFPREFHLCVKSVALRFEGVRSEGWMPGGKFVSVARAWRKDVEDMIQEPFEYTTESLVRRQLH